MFCIENKHENWKDDLLKEINMAQSKTKYSDFFKKNYSFFIKAH